MRALPVRQPFAELIMLGLKTVEYRTRPTTLRGRVHIYACLGGQPGPQDEAWVREKYGIDLDVADLPRGVLVGTVEITACTESEEESGVYEWHLRDAQR